MAWTTPVDQTTGTLVTAAIYNAQIIDNLSYLHGDAGTVDISAGHNQLKADNILTQPNAGAGGFAYQAQVSGDTNPRFGILGSGQFDWGPGNATPDTFLSRKAVGVLANSDGSGHGNFQMSYLNTTGGAGTWTPSGSVFLNHYTMNATGTLTIATPNNPPAATESAFLFVFIQNSSGGTITLSFSSAYQAATPAAPPNGQGCFGLYVWDPATSKWQNVTTGTSATGL